MPAARPYLIFDTETTDLTGPGRDPRLVSLAWGLFTPRGRPLEEHYAIVRPSGFTIPPDATAIHGITTERARREGRPRAEVLGPFLDALRGARAIVAHKLRFDRAIIDREVTTTRDRGALDAIDGYCTMDLAEAHRPSPDLRLGLDTVHRWAVGTPLARPDGVHDALDDMRACARIFFALRRPPATTQPARA